MRVGVQSHPLLIYCKWDNCNLQILIVSLLSGFYQKRIGLKLSELRQRLNFRFNWDYAISDAVGHETTLYQVENISIYNKSN